MKVGRQGGKPVLTFERKLAHRPEKVWRAVSEPEQLARWFPALLETEPRAGAPIKFAFPGEAEVTEGVVLEYDPPKVYAFRWNTDVLRFEILPEADGCRLVFTHVLDENAAMTIARNGAGWDVCLAAQADVLDGREPETIDHRPLMLSYLEDLDLAAGTVSEVDDGYQVRFVLDVVWRPFETVWKCLSEDKPVESGGEVPIRFTTVSRGLVFEADPPRCLAYQWTHEDKAAGEVRWKLHSEPQATYVELIQTVPARLADVLPAVKVTGQDRLEQLFADLLGVPRNPERFQDLQRHSVRKIRD